MPIECFDKYFPELKSDRIKEGMTDTEIRDIGTEIALAEHEKLFNELEGFKKELNPKYKPSQYISPSKKEIIEGIKKEYDEKINAEADKANQQIQLQAEEKSEPAKPLTEDRQGAGIEPPKPPKGKLDVSGEGMEELDNLANNIPDSGKVAEYMSKETIEKYTGETPINDQSRGVQELAIALEHGEKILDKAKELFGDNYVEPTLEYIENSKAGISNKALMYVSLENALGREKVSNPERAAEITKLQALVYEQSQKFARENSLALNYQKLRKIATVGYDLSKITDSFFSPEQIEAKGELNKAIEADADAINKEAEKMEAGGMTPEVEKLVDEGVEREVNKIYESLPAMKKWRADKLDEALKKFQDKLRSRTYEATLGIPVAIVDFGVTVIRRAIKLGATVEQAVEAGIKRMKEKLAEDKDWKGKVWDGEDKFRQDTLTEFRKYAPDTKAIVREALIKNGFGRTTKVKGEEKQILDWKKLAGRAGTVAEISRNVADVFQREGKSKEEIEAIKDSLITEYIDLRTSVIEKAQNEIAKRNKEIISADQKSAAKKLAELYTYGLFDQKAEEFELLTNRALGSKVSESGFKEAAKLAKAMETIYSNSFKGMKLNDVSAKAALERLEDQMRILLFREAKKEGNWVYKVSNLARNYFEWQQTMLLVNLKQTIENPFSGYSQKIIDDINSLGSGTTTKELSAQARKAMKDVYKDMVLKGGMGYGKTESQFVNRQHLDDYVNKLSNNELYHAVASVATGKTTLHAVDAMIKAGITERKFTYNLTKIMTHETNPNRMSKEDALKFVSEKLTGQSFKDAQESAKLIIKKINSDAGKELVPTHQEMIDRFANDIVKASLEMGNKITTEQITAAYNAAYKGAGLGIGHEANNILSGQIKGYSARIEGEINAALKNKEWNRAAALTWKGILYRNIINPFVGGGTNWLVLKLEKTGLGLFTGLAYKVGSKRDIDLSTKAGLSKLEQRLYNQARWKDSMIRGAVGGIVTWGSYGLFLALANTDEYEEWRKKNPKLARYLDIITPEPLLAKMTITQKDAAKSVAKYAANSFNRNDAFSSEEKLMKTIAYSVKGEKDRAWGAFGELAGSKMNAPLPWRLFRDGQVLYQGVTGQDPYSGDYRPSSGFFNGYLQGGVIEYLGWRPNAAIDPDAQIKELSKDPTLKYFIEEKKIRIPEFNPEKIETKEINGKVTERLSDYTEETQKKYLDQKQKYFADELSKLKNGTYEVYKRSDGHVLIKGKDTKTAGMTYTKFKDLTDEQIQYLISQYLSGNSTERTKAIIKLKPELLKKN